MRRSHLQLRDASAFQESTYDKLRCWNEMRFKGLIGTKGDFIGCNFIFSARDIASEYR